MAVKMTKQNNNRDIVVIYSGDVVEVLDDKIRVLVNNEYPKTFVDIKKDDILDIFKKYIKDDDIFEAKVNSIIAQYMIDHPIVFPSIPTV